MIRRQVGTEGVSSETYLYTMSSTEDTKGCIGLRDHGSRHRFGLAKPLCVNLIHGGPQFKCDQFFN